MVVYDIYPFVGPMGGDFEKEGALFVYTPGGEVDGLCILSFISLLCVIAKKGKVFGVGAETVMLGELIHV